ncbi:hypothetical protein JH26_03145 [Microvirga sp. BSC39]|nr:hypothetical protein JH26_03145 [Microvirga sp. BSC39]
MGRSVDAPQQLIGREMGFERERAEQALLYQGTLPILARSFPGLPHTGDPSVMLIQGWSGRQG